jgi:hypothetical protein
MALRAGRRYSASIPNADNSSAAVRIHRIVPYVIDGKCVHFSFDSLLYPQNAVYVKARFIP